MVGAREAEPRLASSGEDQRLFDVVSVYHCPIARGATRGTGAYLGECREELSTYNHGLAHWDEELFRVDLIFGRKIYQGAGNE